LSICLHLEIRLIDPSNEPRDDADQEHVNECPHAPSPAARLTVLLDALIDKIPVDGRQIFPTLSEPTLRLASATPMSSASSFELSGVACHARRAASSLQHTSLQGRIFDVCRDSGLTKSKKFRSFATKREHIT
jgi:hypothetical protein